MQTTGLSTVGGAGCNQTVGLTAPAGSAADSRGTTRQNYPDRVDSELADESRRATELMAGKTIRNVLRLRPTEVLVECTDGSRLHVDWRELNLELSVTDGPADDAANG